jgi:hypothetical protein
VRGAQSGVTEEMLKEAFADLQEKKAAEVKVALLIARPRCARSALD